MLFQIDFQIWNIVMKEYFRINTYFYVTELIMKHFSVYFQCKAQVLTQNFSGLWQENSGKEPELICSVNIFSWCTNFKLLIIWRMLFNTGGTEKMTFSWIVKHVLISKEFSLLRETMGSEFGNVKNNFYSLNFMGIAKYSIVWQTGRLFQSSIGAVPYYPQGHLPIDHSYKEFNFFSCFK